MILIPAGQRVINPAGVYIAGPMRSRPQFNYPAFMAAEEELRLAGYGPIFNPARMDLESREGGPDLGMTIEQQRAHASSSAARIYARRDLLCILDNLDAERFDVLALLPGWELSTGARAEVATALWVGLGFVLLAQDSRVALNPQRARVTL